jgi:hypothetical protein
MMIAFALYRSNLLSTLRDYFQHISQGSHTPLCCVRCGHGRKVATKKKTKIRVTAPFNPRTNDEMEWLLGVAGVMLAVAGGLSDTAGGLLSAPAGCCKDRIKCK